MSAPRFAVQYLEKPPEGVGPGQVRSRLRQAFARLPIDHVLLGWDLPPDLEEAAAEETARGGARLFRWQPLLTGDLHTDLPAEWATIGWNGDPVPGHGGVPEFTFVCPNRSAVADFLPERLEAVAARGLYQGVFLDRIRFPSPSPDPASHLACFCPHCVHLAADSGLDLESVRRTLGALLAAPDGCGRLARSLLGEAVEPGTPLEAFLDFRQGSLDRIVAAASRQAAALGLEVGLDCFSPSLTRMVGQNLSTLDGTCKWIKIMAYPRVFGPAGIAFELLGLAEWLVARGLPQAQALGLLAGASRLEIPATLAELRQTGLGAGALRDEIARARELGVKRLLAGLALVAMAGVHESTPDQIRADIAASRMADGLVLSWDLWLTPLTTLDAIRQAWP
ncbi:MAG: hypothetical protein JXB85_12055 [Anaerolineales bacterium]|nr:hypothetical protein [Anaerolineales bacterium]